MRIDKEKLQALSTLSDEELWKTICEVATSHGIKAPSTPPKAEDMAKIKSALASADRASLAGALRLIDKYRKGKC